MKTQLDEVAEKAKADPETHMDDFYTCFMNSMIYLHTWDVPEEDFNGIKEEETPFHPVIVEDGEDKLILIFDRQERAVQYAEGRDDLGIIGMKGHQVFEVLGLEFFLILNPKTDLEKEFTPDEVKHILDHATQEII